MVDLHFIVPIDQDEREVLSSLHEGFLKEVQVGEKLSRLELAISNACNFGCQHCMHFLNNEVPSRIDPVIESRLPGDNDFCKGCEIEGSCAGQCQVTLESSRNDSQLVRKMCELMIATTQSLVYEYLEGR